MTRKGLAMNSTTPAESAEKRFRTVTSLELAEKEFPELEYVIPGILPVGVSLLVAPPKVGKSWLCLQLAHAFATGGKMFGHLDTGSPRPVLYLSLEDSQRRLQKRMNTAGYAASPNLEFATDLQGFKITDLLREWLSEHLEESPLVIVDILGKVMPQTTSNQSQYLHETQVIGSMKMLIDEVNNAGLILVHHTRKAGADDFIDRASGTQGLAGAMDTILVIDRSRQSKRATLHVTSRDVEENEYSIIFSDSCQWVLDGSSIEEAKSSAQKARIEHNLGTFAQEVLTEITRHPEGISPQSLKEVFPEQANKVDMTVKRLYDSERITKLERGLYALPSVSFDRTVSYEGKLTELTQLTPPSGTDCEICGEPLHPIVISEGFTTHPSCPELAVAEITLQQPMKESESAHVPL